MTKAVLLHKTESRYDDVPWDRYHFPKRYLRAMNETVGDWIVYHEPKTARPPGRQAYFAVARVERIEDDPREPDSFYAFVSRYQELADAVPLKRTDGSHYETGLRKPDGTTNRGLQQRSVRKIADADFFGILRAGIMDAAAEFDQSGAATGGVVTEVERPVVEQILSRPLRDAGFRGAVLKAYDSACAFTGLRILNGKGRAEVDAAHIRPVGHNHGGPDSVRNGLALSKTVHWLFDRGVIAIGDDYRILESPGRMPPRVRALMNRDGRIRVPKRPSEKPYPDFLAYHREMFEDLHGSFRPLDLAASDGTAPPG